MYPQTNIYLGDLDLTMIRQMSRRGRIGVAFREDRVLKPLGQILEPSPTSIDGPPMQLSGGEEAVYLQNSSPLDKKDYDKLLRYLERDGRDYRSVHEKKILNQVYPFLLPYVRKHTEVHIGDRTFSILRSHEGNSAIQFAHPTTERTLTGFIEEIWSTPLRSRIETFFVVRPHRRLSGTEERKAPFADFNEKYGVQIFDGLPTKARNQLLIMQERHIITHLSTFRRPAGTYGIPRGTLVVCWSLNRGRRGGSIM